ncbi:DUF945 family protein [Aliidiomarina sp.]|uniref:DUF945 family protein n=1 Tax=Aliidiomarina sp. TaxID=1872439 RepID=UPI003A4D2FD7
MRKGIIAVIAIAVVVVGYVVGVITTKQATYNAIENLVVEMERQENAQVEALWQDQSARSATLLLNVSADTGIPDMGAVIYTETIDLRYGFLNTKWSGTGDFQLGEHTASEALFAGQPLTSEGVVSRGGLRVRYLMPELNYEIASGLVFHAKASESALIMAGEDVRVLLNAPEFTFKGAEGNHAVITGINMSSDTRNLHGEMFSNAGIFSIDSVALNLPDFAEPITIEGIRNTFEVLRKDDELQAKGSFAIAQVDGEPAVRGSGRIEWLLEGIDYQAFRDLEAFMQSNTHHTPDSDLQERVVRAALQSELVTLRLNTFEAETESWGSLRSNGVLSLDLRELSAAERQTLVLGTDLMPYAHIEMNFAELPPMLQLMAMAISTDPLPWKLEFRNNEVWVNGELLDLSQMQ